MHLTTPASFPLATLDAVLKRITYTNEEAGYTVARVTTGRDSVDLCRRAAHQGHKGLAHSRLGLTS
jgi:hypothetical protein